MVHISQIMPTEGERPLFAVGEQVRVIRRFPIGHHRVPRYIRGKRAIVKRVIEPMQIALQRTTPSARRTSPRIKSSELADSSY